jgi:hypothetical protein
MWKFVTKNMKQIKLFSTYRHFYSHIGLVWFMVFNCHNKMEKNNSIIFFEPGMYFHNDYV